MKTMPKVDRSKLQVAPEWADVVEKVIKPDGTIRASKPQPPRMTWRPIPGGEPYDVYHEYADEEGERLGLAAYVWRMVVFFVSPRAEHQCMPVCATFDLPGDAKSSAALAKRLDAEVVDPIVRAVRVEDWHGVRRWGQAWGMIGTPRYNSEGAVIYR